MIDSFIIPPSKIDTHWSAGAVSYDFCGFEYCEEVLSIPSEHMDEAHVSNVGLEIKLNDVSRINDDDWYIQLLRLTRFS